MLDKTTIFLVIVLIGSGYLIIQDEKQLNDEQLNETQLNSTENISLYLGHNWNPEDGYNLVLKSINARDNPKKVWLRLYKNGSRIEDKIIKEGETYNYHNEFNTTISQIYNSEIILIKKS